jgi:predicted RNase H-like HicB family nuclease
MMSSTKYVYWQEDDAWIGYLQDFPDYWTQGTSRADLEEHLKDLFLDMTSGDLSGIR